MPARPSPGAAIRVLSVTALLAVATATPFRAAEAVIHPATRAVWVTRTSLASPETVTRMVRAAGAAGFNTLLIQVRGRGDAYFTGGLEPRAADLAARPEFDPLALTLELAQAAGLQVHAWVAVNLVSSAFELPASNQHIVYRNPDWLMVPRELASEMRTIDVRSPAYVGTLARWTRAHSSEVEGLYASPLVPGAATHVADVIGDLVRRYSIDGLHLDYARYPSDAFDYSPSALDQFRRAILPELTAAERSDAAARESLDPLAYPNLFGDRWNAFRRSRLTALVMRIRTAAKQARPGIILSAAVVPDVRQAFDERLQDWRTWLDQSLIDVLCPMAYTPDSALFQQQVAMAKAYAGDRPVWAGIGAYRLNPAQIVQNIDAATRLGSAGVILFSYDSLIAPPNSIGSFAELGRAAFGSGSN